MNPSLIHSELRRSPVRRLIAEQIRNGSLRPGDRLSPGVLAAELGLSATPLREALIELVRDGYLDNRPQYGFAVRPLRAKEVEELYPMVSSIESLAIRDQVFDSQRLGELDRINERFAKARNPGDVAKLDAIWHSTLVSGCGNETLHEILGVIKSRIQRYEDAYIRYSGAMPASAKQHRAITRALRVGDVQTAEKVLNDNWLAGIGFLVPWLEAHAPNNPG